MIIKCAWCGKNMGEKQPYDDKDITHGMCSKCLKRELAKIEKMRQAEGKELSSRSFFIKLWAWVKPIYFGKSQ